LTKDKANAKMQIEEVAIKLKKQNEIEEK